MINIDKFKTFVYAVANKNGRGTITPEKFNSITERALYAWTNNQVSNHKQYQVDNPTPVTSMDLDTVSMSRLRHLKTSHDIRVINNQASLPDGVNTDVNSVVMAKMWIPSRIMHKYAKNGALVERSIDLVKDMEWGLRTGSSIVGPTKKNAIANMQSDHLVIEPKNLITIINFTYIRNPNAPVWAYTTTNNRPVYDANSSVDIDAPESAFNEIALIALEFMGIQKRDMELVQNAVGMENKGA
jgi:hypothetical protein